MPDEHHQAWLKTITTTTTMDHHNPWIPNTKPSMEGVTIFGYDDDDYDEDQNPLNPTLLGDLIKTCCGVLFWGRCLISFLLASWPKGRANKRTHAHPRTDQPNWNLQTINTRRWPREEAVVKKNHSSTFTLKPAANEMVSNRPTNRLTSPISHRPQ